MTASTILFSIAGGVVLFALAWASWVTGITRLLVWLILYKIQRMRNKNHDRKGA
jgi:hypothetical protein